MLAEHDQMRALDWLRAVELCEEVIRRRAGRAAFGGEQLDEHRRIGGVCTPCSCKQGKGGGEGETPAPRAANQSVTHEQRLAALRRLNQGRVI
jgi:hypothetical protein